MTARLKIKHIRTIGEPQLVSLMRHVKVFGHGQVEAYRFASIKICPLNPNLLWPTYPYITHTQIARAHALRDSLKDIMDLFALTGSMYVELGDIKKSFHVLPPIVEIDGGTGQCVIVDGLARCKAAKDLDVTINCLVIEGARVPTEALSLERGWDDVRVVDIAPTGKRQGSFKSFREPEHPLDLERNFNAVFPGLV